jgi:hypothetical protein
MKLLLSFLCSFEIFFLFIGHAQNNSKTLSEAKLIQPYNHLKALLIGNKNYKYAGSLNNTERDVDSLHVVLKRIGFEVTPLKNQTLNLFQSNFKAFLSTIKENDIVIFYFSGHGLNHNKENYLLPIEANIKNIEDFDNQCIKLSTILEDFNGKKPKNKIFLWDACRDNQLSFPESKGFIRTEKHTEKSMIVFATREGATADDNTFDKFNSLFTSELIKYIGTTDLSIRDIIDQVKTNVEDRSKGKQSPTRIDDMNRDFYLTKLNVIPTMRSTPAYVETDTTHFTRFNINCPTCGTHDQIKIVFSDGVFGFLFKGGSSQNYFIVSKGIPSVKYLSKEEGVRALYQYKAYGIIKTQ